MVSPLTVGDHGDHVKALQAALATHRFDPGEHDGRFLGGTEAAVLGFQHSEGLLADGVVGANTARALGLAAIPDAPVLTLFTVDLAMLMFRGAKRANIERFLPPVLQALQEQHLVSHMVVLGTLATIRAETAGFIPLNEFVSRFNTAPNGRAFGLYDHRKDLGNSQEGDGARYKGRGFVQLTGKANYKKYGDKIGVDLIADPDEANEPVVAARLLAAFVKDCELRFKRALLADDMREARKCVNGGSHGLEDFTNAYKAGFAQLIP